MKKIQRTENMIGRSTGFAIDTTFVLFFLALEFGDRCRVLDSTASFLA
jgi:hypothetical protein